MEYRKLGKTDIEVSRMCFGALTVGPLQANLSVREGARVIRRALELGVNFIDTAQLYGTYPYIKEALRGFNGEVFVSSKSYAYLAEDMKKSLEEALRETDREVIDIFMLHEQESHLTIKGHWEALEYLVRAKEKGLVRAVGISSHTVAAVSAAAEISCIDVIHPLINKKGLGIQDGTAEDMLAVIRKARAAGKGIFGMKPLGGGNLLKDREEAFAYVLALPELDSIALGMKSTAEVEMNIRIFNNEPVPEELKREVSGIERKLHIEDWCEGCGKCTARCHSKALYLEDGKANVRKENCILCGYCSQVCPYFCIKIV